MTALAVVVAVVAVILVLVVVPVMVTRRWARERDAYWAAFDAEVAAGDERVLAPREPGSYRGGTAGRPQVKGNGWLVLTDRRLLFRKTTGPVIEVPVADITGARLETVYLGSRVAGKRHVVVRCADGSEVGFYVGDPDAWVARLAALPGA